MMASSLAQLVIASFGLTRDQRASALEREKNVIVTAGAGSGKTRTLVARYASLLADGLTPRNVVAITFTKKAAREMRSRLREALNKLASEASSSDDQENWLSLGNQMDSARIGTIHSLCTEILRSHPAEAGVDPRFEVLEEGATATLKNQVVDDVLKTMVAEVEYRPLFKALEISGVQNLLMNTLDRRLEAREIFEKQLDGDAIIHNYIETALRSSVIASAITDLRGFTPQDLIADADAKLAALVTDLLVLWKEAEAALDRGDLIGCGENLFRARREKMLGTVGKKSGRTKAIVATLRQNYDEVLDFLIGGKSNQDVAPSMETESLFKEIRPLAQKGSELAHHLYETELRQRHALDFDDLEYGAVQLLKQDGICNYWQKEVQALLVDEFQDTNSRQREIVEALIGEHAGRLFVVGDARQSIYRFRRADVAIFRSVQEQANKKGDLILDLDITYRAHEPLLNTMGDLLASVMGVDNDPARSYYVPFTPLSAYRKTHPENISDPHVEFIFGAAEDSNEARPVAARALIRRLLDLKNTGQIKNWDEVALLFRASTGYAHYEDAFEEADIPFVTVSGRGFFDRPEIRDVLNLLSALANPADDLAMAGLLRSPAFGLSDHALYQLRIQAGSSTPYWSALHRNFSMLNATDQARAKRTLTILEILLPQVDRKPVAELLKTLVDITDYRAILAADNERGSSGRLWRNLDKLISDAQTSGYVNVRDFLEYLSNLSDSGAREGEASADALGAISLMTIHKSKGLEFPVVVLADAGRDPNSQSDMVYLLPEMGLTIKLDPAPMLYRFSKDLDKQQNEAESGRLLYVALTRAKDKLIISGHATSPRGGAYRSSGWMHALCESFGLDIDNVVNTAGNFSKHETVSKHPLLVWCIPAQEMLPEHVSRYEEIKEHEIQALSLYHPLLEIKPGVISEDETEIKRIWRATESAINVPAGVIGQMTHKALELWLSVDNPRLIPLLESLALSEGLASQPQRIEAVRRVRELIERFGSHPLHAEIEMADERHHEVSYSRMNNEQAETGYIDLIYRKGKTWNIVDFKTDFIHSPQDRDEFVRLYSRQAERYASAVQTLLGEPAQVSLCFLDDSGRVSVARI